MAERIPHSSQLVKYWDDNATTKEFRHPIPQRYIDKYFRSFASVIDMGCGQGRLSRQLSEMGFIVSGADTSAVMINEARKNAIAGDFRECPDSKLDWFDNVFDIAIAVTLLTSVPSSTEQTKIISELKRVLKPGGYLFVSDMPLQWSARYTDRYQKGQERYGQYGVFDLDDGSVVRHHELGYFMQLVSGFTALELETHEITTMNGNPAQAIRYLGRKDDTD